MCVHMINTYIYIYIYIYVYIHMYIYAYIYIGNFESYEENKISRLGLVEPKRIKFKPIPV